MGLGECMVSGDATRVFAASFNEEKGEDAERVRALCACACAFVCVRSCVRVRHTRSEHGSDSH